MCCSTSVFPVDKTIAEAVLALGEFAIAPNVDGYGPPFWEREVVEDDGSRVTVRGQVVADKLNLSLLPAIHNAGEHRRISGGVYFEVACKVAEKCNSKIVQSSNVMECVENSERTKLLADYPLQPMMWDAVCLGFQGAILGT